VRDQLPACQTVFDVAGDLFTHRCQLKQLVPDDRIVSLLGKLPILGRFVPQIVGPIRYEICLLLSRALRPHSSILVG
jgi:hypothetical protein